MRQTLESKVPKLDIVLSKSADGSSFEIYRAASAAQVEITLLDGSSPQDFFIDAATYQLPQATVTPVRSCAQNVRRAPAQIALDAAPTMQLTLYVEGEGNVVSDSNREHFRPGDICILDSSRGHEATVTAFDLRIITVSRDRAPAIFLSPAVHGMRLPAGEPSTRLLSASIETLVHELDGLTVSEADHAIVAICQLAASAIETQLTRRAQKRWDDPILGRAMAFIDARFREPDLGPEAVRAHLGISRSAVYRLFAPVGGIEAAVRVRRLDNAMRAILTGIEPTLSIKDMATQHGFRGETHFVRAFQTRFGATPLQCQTKVATDDHTWLRAQAKRAGFVSLDAWRGALANGSPSGPGGAAEAGQ